MAVKPSITEQIEELENQNLRLQEYEKLINQMLKSICGLTLKDAKYYTENQQFFKKIADTFKLKNAEDFEAFLTVFCNEKSVRYFNENRSKNEVNSTDAAQQDRFHSSVATAEP